VVTDEVRIYKEPVTEERQVSDTVRKERVTVDGAEEVRGADATDTTYSDRTSWQDRSNPGTRPLGRRFHRTGRHADG